MSKPDNHYGESPKTYLFRAVKGLRKEVEGIEDHTRKLRAIAMIEVIESWEPLIRDVDDPPVNEPETSPTQHPSSGGCEDFPRNDLPDTQAPNA